MKQHTLQIPIQSAELLFPAWCNRMEAEMLRDAHAEEGDLSIYAENLLMLMQRYAWSIPSAYYQTTPDVSLYDHSRMTGALAAVLMDLSDDQISAMLESSHDQSTEEVALLVGGDISGVQDFIYTITSKGAASALRGRSFYLQLLTEAIARYTLRRLDLPVTNLIYQGGGNFYILARASDREQLTEIGPGTSKKVDVTYNAINNSAGGVLEIVSNDPDEGTVHVVLKGNNFGVDIGVPAPDFDLPYIANGSGSLHLQDLVGKVVVLAFFASW